MDINNWIGILNIVITNATVVWSVVHKLKKDSKDSTEDPNRKQEKPKTSKLFLLILAFSIAISLYNILVYVNEPSLDNVISLCLGVSVIFFNIVILIFSYLFDRIIGILKNNGELIRSFREFSKPDIEHTRKVVSVVEKLAESYSAVKKDIDTLNVRVDELKDKIKK